MVPDAAEGARVRRVDEDLIDHRPLGMQAAMRVGRWQDGHMREAISKSCLRGVALRRLASRGASVGAWTIR